jgi:hypothetical protein
MAPMRRLSRGQKLWQQTQCKQHGRLRAVAVRCHLAVSVSNTAVQYYFAALTVLCTPAGCRGAPNFAGLLPDGIAKSCQ